MPPLATSPEVPAAPTYQAVMNSIPTETVTIALTWTDGPRRNLHIASTGRSMTLRTPLPLPEFLDPPSVRSVRSQVEGVYPLA